MPKTFLVSDESVNSYGSRILTDGLDVTDFLKNPIMLFNHKRSNGYYKDEILPIGKWVNLRKENGKWLADPEFDLNDEFAAKIAAKVDGGFLNACSVGVNVVEMSEDPKMIKPGQTRPTLTRCKLVEISITDIPSNKNAVALYDADHNLVSLSAIGECPIPLLTSLSQSNKSNTSEMNEVQTLAMLLGCEANLTALTEAVNKLKTDAGKVVTLSAQIKQFEDVEKTRKTTEVETLLSQAVTAKKITEAQKPAFVALFAADHDNTKKVLNGMQVTVSLSDYVNPADQPGGSNDKIKHQGMTFAELSQKNPQELERLQAENVELFNQLYKSQYGKDYRPTVR